MSEKNCCRYKKKPRDPQVKKDVVRRLNRAQGQIGGIRQMVEDERYCSDMLIQLAAVQSAIKAISRSEERRVGKECLRLCRSRWSPYH